MAIIALTNQKGGCGKTTTALQLSAVLVAVNTPPNAPTDWRSSVLYVDTDPQQSGTVVVQEAAAAHAEKAAEVDSSEKLRIDPFTKRRVTGCDLSTGQWNGLPFDSLSVDEIEDIARIPGIARERGYRHVVVDTAGSFADLSFSEAAVSVSDFAVIPVLADKMSRLPAQRTIETIVRPRLGNRFGVAVVNWDTHHKNDLLATVDWAYEHEYPLFDQPVRAWRLIARNTICTLGARSTASREAESDYKSLAIAITQGA